MAEPGAVFGELSVLLDKPHTAEVRALEPSQFHVANAATLFSQDPVIGGIESVCQRCSNIKDRDNS